MKKSRRSRIATQLLVWFLLLTLVPLIVAAFLTTRTARQLLTDQIENNLRAMADNLGQQVEAFLRGQERDLLVLAANPGTADAIDAFSAAWKNGALDENAHNAAAARFAPFLRRAAESIGTDDIYLIDPDGRVVFSTARGPDFGVKIDEAPVAGTTLGRAAQSARFTLGLEQSDFDFYGPDALPATFMCRCWPMESIAGSPCCRSARRKSTASSATPPDWARPARWSLWRNTATDSWPWPRHDTTRRRHSVCACHPREIPPRCARA
jgi:hypothetical protein